ncbi:hypothetical protein EBZ38_15955 [bacterium]|nr:hypothetical protein [bacterium]
MKQTAVEWLIEQLTPSITLQQKYIDELKEQAKAIEEEQIVNDCVDFVDWIETTSYTRQDYGNEWESCLPSNKEKRLTTKQLFELYKNIKNG